MLEILIFPIVSRSCYMAWRNVKKFQIKFGIFEIYESRALEHYMGGPYWSTSWREASMIHEVKKWGDNSIKMLAQGFVYIM